MTTYKSDASSRSVDCDSAQEAAQYFAGIIARREHGQRGEFCALRCDSWTDTVTNWQVFVGCRADSRTKYGRSNRGIDGRNQYFQIWKA
jgi:hypothetical protein